MENSNTERLRLAAELVNDYIVDWNVQTDEVYFSSRWKHLLGYMDDEIPGNFEGWLMTVEPDYQENFKAGLYALRDGKIPLSSIERKAVCKDGSLIWITSKAKVVEWGKDGIATRVIGIFSNINEKKLAEEKLAEEYSRYAAIINSSDDLIFNLDEQYHLLAANKVFYVYAKKISGREYHTGESLEGFIQVLQTYFNCQHLLNSAFKGERQDGEYHFNIPALQINNWTVYSLIPSQEINGISTVVIRVKDISESKKAEKDIIDARNRFQSLFQKHAAIMILIEPETEHIFDANEAALQFYGYSYKQLTAMKIRDLAVIPIDELLDNFKKIITLSKNFLIVPHRLASGEIRIVEVWTSPIQENEKMLFYAVIHDITEKVKAEQQLQVEKDNFKTILKALPDLIFRLDKDNRFVYYHTINQADLLMPEEAFIGKLLTEVIPEPLLSLFISKINEAHAAKGDIVKYEYSMEIPAQGFCWFEARLSSAMNADIVVVIRNITQEIQSEEALRKSNRFYEFTSKVNNLIIYASDENELFKQVCTIAVDTGGFHFSFIGGPDITLNTIHFYAWAGYEAGYLDVLHAKFSLGTRKEGNGPFGKALREGKHIYCNDIQNDPLMELWREEALQRGYQSSIALPIKPEKETEFVLSFYSNKPNSFSEEEVLLLDRVAANISYALKNLRNNKKKAETEIQLKKITQAVEQNSASVVITDVNGNIEYVNPAFCKLSGYSAAEAIGQNPRILKSGYTSPTEYVQLWNQLVQQQTWSGEFCNVRKDGSTYWEYAVISPILNEGGTITHYVSVKENITERKALEEDLKEKIRIIEVAQNVAQIGTYIIDLEERTWESSVIFDQIFGLDADFEKQMDQFYSLVLPEYLIGMEAQAALAQQHKQSFSYKFKARRKDTGQIRWMESYGIFIFDEEGTARQMIGAMQDVTVIETLVEEREQIIESINDYFYVLDKNMNFKYCNQAFAKRFLQGEGKDFLGKNLYTLFPGVKGTEILDHLIRVIETGTSDHFEYYMRSDERFSGWYEEHMYPFENGISVLFRDISKRKETEENLLKLNTALNVKTQELTNTNTELERFAYVASHDLQEPLRMVSSFMQLFEKKYAGIVDEAGKKYIHFAVDGAERMKALIKDLLQYSRAGSGSLEIIQVNMNEVLKEVLLLFKNEIYQVDAEIKYGNLPTILAGKSAMIQLMQNLIGNALKYRRKENPEVEISAEENEQEWIIHVRDNGIGIESQYFEKIFIIFQRLHNKDEYSGTGIGLSVCKKIVERYKGKIWVVSEPGKGSVFSFSIPKAIAAP